MRVKMQRAPDPRAWPWAVVLGAVAVLIGVWRIGEPSLMGDEAVTVSIATRSPGALWAMVSANMDAVHAAYYAGMHVWFSMFGADAVSLRVPSAIAVGVAVAGVVLIGSVFVSRTVGIVAGILLMVTPASLLVATIGRSQGVQLALVTWLAFLLLLALERGRTWRWIIVGALVALAMVTFLFTVFVVVAFGVAVLIHRPWRSRLLPFMAAVFVGGLAAVPVALLGYRQRGQVSWIEPIGWDVFDNVLVKQWFSGVIWVDSAYPGWVAYVTAVIFLGLAVLGAVVGVKEGGVLRGVTSLSLAWMLLPTFLLVAVSLVGTPFYSPPYLAMSVPAVALLGALGVASLTARWLRVALVAALIALAVPPYLAMRAETAHGTDWTAIARTLDSEGEAGDAVLVESEPWDQPHLLFELYPDETRGLRDVALSGHTNPVALWGDRAAPGDLQIAGDVERVWIVSTSDGNGEWDQQLRSERFREDTVIELSFSTLTLFSR
ncbi:glycosyltransferase family 39 protein [Microbacterium sp. CFH 31415]|uniref:glycosyltransferase family 39 protein n=1 Tax=Microbacterium sp. CFH 31415 TaxID=2921732 RepID=UPI001F13F2CF|nr:glycosyltransferase family 39 protein [Microbacterium sp. CFH 31415]MCH6230754.1 glycosyltransferase family 39 protein [Microbacterium sp. CFH 31415]